MHVHAHGHTHTHSQRLLAKQKPAHAASLLKTLEWLPKTLKIKSKVLTMVYKALQDLTLT